MLSEPATTSCKVRRVAGAGFTACAIAVISLAAGCADMSERQKGTAGGAIGAVAGNLWSKRMEDKRRALAQASAGTGVQVERTTDNRLKLNVPADASFDTGRADIKPTLRPVLDEVSRNLDPKVTLSVVGHTDNTGSDAVNDPLSRERAEAVRDYLTARGVPSQRIAVAGRGSHEPVASNDTDSGRAANRRVEIYLVEAAG